MSEMLHRVTPDVAPVMLGDGLIRYRLSTSERARDGLRILTPGWVLDNFRKNPQFLFAHKADQFPIGRVENIETVGDELRGSVRFADYPEAQLARQLVVDGFMPAVSVGFQPLEWDRSQSGVITRAELLECSAVAVGALPSALTRALADPAVNARKLSLRAGKMLSSQNETDLRQAHREISAGHQMVADGADKVLAVCDRANGTDVAEEDAADSALEARAMRARQVRAKYLGERYRRELAAAIRAEFLQSAR